MRGHLVGRGHRRGRFAAYGIGVVLATVVASCSSASADGHVRAESTQPSATTAAKEAAAVSIAPAGGPPISPSTPIVVSVAHGTLNEVTVLSPKGKKVAGALSADRSRWTTSEPLGYGSTYQVTADAVGEDGQTAHQVGAVHTLSPQAQAYPSLIPPPSIKEVGVGQPIVVRFDRSITDRAAAEKALQVTSVPAQPGGWYWMSNKEVHYRPQHYWQAGTDVTLKVSIYGVDLGDGVYGQTDRTASFHVHDSWVAQADGKTKQMKILHNGALVKTMPISLGSPEHPSHNGPHVVSFKAEKYIMDSSTYGVNKGDPGYYREEVLWDERISNDGEFVHAAPWSEGQQGSSNVSHGCVNLSVENAIWFYKHFGLGDVVEITNSGGKQLPVWDTYGDWMPSWAEWQAGSALA
ncbi:MAG TPA: Ig-like domain-containing protein [Mycobacteriales bacterium]